MDSVVRKASSLKTLDELHLSKEALWYCRYMPISDLVSTARHQYHCMPKSTEYHGWLDEVKQALDLAGFIRHDFNSESFAIGRLYQSVSHVFRDSTFAGGFYDLVPNEKYETYRNLTPQEVKAVLMALDRNLTENEARAVKLHFGLDPESKNTGNFFGRTEVLPMEAEEIASIMGITKTEARTAVFSAIKKLWRPGTLPIISQFATE